MRIHPSAIVSPLAQIGSDVQIGPFCLVDEDVVVGPGCILESRVALKQGTVLGANNHVFEGAVLGGLPQHIHVPDHPGRIILGSNNTVRENVTIHRTC